MQQLRAAFARVHDNAGQAGVDGVEVDDFGVRIEANLRELQSGVLGGRYVPQPLKRVWLPRPGKAPRPLGVPTVRDRVLQTAVAMVLAPVLEEEFEDCSFAYRQGRSVRQAVERIGLLQRQGYEWVVEADIERFFDLIPHDRLIAELRRTVPDEALASLVAAWLAAPAQEGEVPGPPTTIGIPQGSPISPLLANLYLDHLDEAMVDGNFALVRYADDFIVLARSQERAQAALRLSADVLERLRLRLNPLKTRVVHFDQGFRFLGWNFVRSMAIPARRVGSEAAAPGLRPMPAPPEVDDEAAPAHARGADTPLSTAMAEAFADASTDALAEAPAAADGDDGDGPQPAEPLHSLQRTLYVVDPTVSLATANGRLLLRRADETVLDVPAAQIDQVMLLARVPITTAAIVCCMRQGIPVALLSRMGRFHGRIEPPQGAAATLLVSQVKAHLHAELCLALARAFVQGKLANAALVLARYARHRAKTDAEGAAMAHQAVLQLKDHHRQLRAAATLEAIRGHEGASAVAYFDVWRHWLGARWAFGARQQQAGGDRINALLDLGYTLLHHAVAGLVQARGLSPWIGHLHAIKAGHMALASDLMEEFRPLAVDAVVLNLCLNGGLEPDDFTPGADGWALRQGPAKAFVRSLETRWNTERQHPRHAERLDLRRIIDGQVRDLITTYRTGDTMAYRACEFR